MAAVWIWHSNELYNHINSESLGPALDLQIPIIPLATQQASKEDSSKEKPQSDSLIYSNIWRQCQKFQNTCNVKRLS